MSGPISDSKVSPFLTILQFLIETKFTTSRYEDTRKLSYLVRCLSQGVVPRFGTLELSSLLSVRIAAQVDTV